MKMTLMLLALFLMASCSQKAVYQNVQLNERRECSERPPSEYEECMEAVSQSYEDYRRERKEVIDE